MGAHVTDDRQATRELSNSIKDRKVISQVGSISANNDATIGDIIAEAMEKVGKDGVITVEEAKGTETNLEVVEAAGLPEYRGSRRLFSH